MPSRAARCALPESELVRYLQMSALDDDFRALAQADPTASFAGFDLAEEDRAVLARQDASTLALLARAVSSLVGDGAVGVPARSEPTAPTVQALDPLDLHLHLTPVQTADGLRHQATLSVEPSAQGASTQIRVRPLAEPRGEQLAVHYQVDLVRADPPRPTAVHRTWDHAVDSPAARDAAARVLEAPAGQRREALGALVDALTERL